MNLIVSIQNKLNILFLIILGIHLLQLDAQTMVQVNASDPNIQYTGRIDNSNSDQIIFSYPGVSIKAKFEGTAIDALITDYAYGGNMHTNYFNVIIDNGTPTSLMVSSAQYIYPLARGLADGVHTVELFKRTESNVGKTEFDGFQLEAGKNLLSPDPLPAKKIEFIGNSITCGYGDEASYTATQLQTITGFNSVNENNYKAWGAITARNLNAQYSCIAYSGRGLYRNNSGSITGTLPQIYDYVIPDEATVVWDHTKFIPDVIVINLGTNDFSAEASGYADVDSATFVNTYVDFISKLRGYYPKTKIICVVGVMMSDYWPAGKKHWTRIQQYVTAVKDFKNQNGDKDVYYFKLNPQNAPYGEDWHPTVQTQNSMATNLTNFINTLNVWTCTTHVNLGDDLTTCGKTFPITLYSNTSTNNGVTFKWFKDDVMIQNASANTFQITTPVNAVGKYKVVRDSAICSTSDEINIRNDMIKPNLGNAIELCNPAIANLDAGVSTEGISYLWKKNNQTIKDVSSKTLQVSSSGTYMVEVKAGNCSAVSDPVTITSKLLAVTDDTLCNPGLVTLSVSGGLGPYEWYNTSEGGGLLNSGTEFKTTVTGDSLFFVKDAGGVSSTLGKTEKDGATYWNIASNIYQQNDKQVKLIVKQACTLVKLAVYTYASGYDVTIRLMNGTKIIATKTQTNVGADKQYIQLDFLLQPGTYNLDAVGTTGYLIYQADGALFPYSIPNVIDMTNTETWTQTLYGLFYDLEIKVGNPCNRTPVPVVIDGSNSNCKQLGFDSKKKQETNIILFPNPVINNLTILFTDTDNEFVIEIENLTGQKLIEKQINISNDSEIQLDLSGLTTGMYFVKLSSPDTVVVKRVIKK